MVYKCLDAFADADAYYRDLDAEDELQAEAEQRAADRADVALDNADDLADYLLHAGDYPAGTEAILALAMRAANAQTDADRAIALNDLMARAWSMLKRLRADMIEEFAGEERLALDNEEADDAS